MEWAGQGLREFAHLHSQYIDTVQDHVVWDVQGVHLQLCSTIDPHWGQRVVRNVARLCEPSTHTSGEGVDRITKDRYGMAGVRQGSAAGTRRQGAGAYRHVDAAKLDTWERTVGETGGVHTTRSSSCYYS